MCGIVAHIAKSERGRMSSETFAAMLRSLERRGPDDSTTFTRDAVTLGHRRLSIIDLAGGAQPVFNETRSVACILNGEIYNFRELRARLEKQGHRFQTHSDTEVIVHLYEDVGEQVFTELVGMFAVVLADFERGRILIGRDRMGEKPLYYVDTPDFFSCSSELKSFKFHPGVPWNIDRSALARYLRFGWIPGSDSIIEGIGRLEPAHYLVLEAGKLRKQRYWQPDLTPLAGVSRAELCEMIRGELARTIENKLIADVPLGVFLSGGLDSSTVVALAAQHSSAPLKTFSVSFGEEINELPYARSVARRYGTEHTELDVVTDLESAIGVVAEYFDEPFADSSSIPTYLISKAAREHVTVILTGDGGDELLAGYEGYSRLRTYTTNRWLGRSVRIGDAIAKRASNWSLADAMYPLSCSTSAYHQWLESRATMKLEDVHGVLGERSSGIDPTGPAYLALAERDPISQAFEFDLNYYLPDDLLKKVDMASMASSLECRAPFLDHRVVELCMRIPPLAKVRHGLDKSLLREAMAPHLPREVLEREKQGFGAPLAHWLGGPLKHMVDDLASRDAKLGEIGDGAQMRGLVNRSRATLQTDWRAPLRLWTLLMLEQWLQRHFSR